MWARSIPTHHLVQSMPAVALILAMILLGSVAVFSKRDWRERSQRALLKTALDKGELATAALVLRRQLASRPVDLATVYQLAEVQGEQGETSQAIETMRGLLETEYGDQAARWLYTHAYASKPWSELSSNDKVELGFCLSESLSHHQVIYKSKAFMQTTCSLWIESTKPFWS